MPKLKSLSQIIKEQEDNRTRAMIAYVRVKRNLDVDGLGKRIGISESGLYRRISDPQSLKLSEIRLLVKYGELTKDQVVELVGVEL